MQFEIEWNWSKMEGKKETQWKILRKKVRKIEELVSNNNKIIAEKSKKYKMVPTFLMNAALRIWIEKCTCNLQNGETHCSNIYI